MSTRPQIVARNPLDAFASMIWFYQFQLHSCGLVSHQPLVPCHRSRFQGFLPAAYTVWHSYCWRIVVRLPSVAIFRPPAHLNPSPAPDVDPPRVTPPPAAIATAFIPMHDPRASAHWYADVFGLDVIEEKAS